MINILNAPNYYAILKIEIRGTATKSTLLSTLNRFTSALVIPENSTALVDIRTKNINVQVICCCN